MLVALVTIASIPSRKELTPKKSQPVIFLWLFSVQYILTALNLLNIWLYLEETKVEQRLLLTDSTFKVSLNQKPGPRTTSAVFSDIPHRNSGSTIFQWTDSKPKVFVLSTSQYHMSKFLTELLKIIATCWVHPFTFSN